MTSDADPVPSLAAIDAALAAIDARLTSALDAVLRHPAFQQMEAAWRGLALVVERAAGVPGVEIALLSCTKEELAADLLGAPAVEQSALHGHLVRDPLALPGGAPFAAVLADFAFGPGGDDVALLGRCALLAQRAQAPFLAAASPALLGLARFEELDDLSDVQAIFDAPSHAAFRDLRETDEAGYLGLFLPRFRLRSGSPSLFGNPIYAFATCLARSFARYGWCFDVVGRTDGRIDDLPSGAPPTDVAIGENLDRRLAHLGLVTLASVPETASAFFREARSLRRPRYFGETEEGRAAALNDELEATLPHFFIITRVAHYVHAAARDLIGPGVTRIEIEQAITDLLDRHTADARVGTARYHRRHPFRKTLFKLRKDDDYTLRVRPWLKHQGAFFSLHVSGLLPFAIDPGAEPAWPAAAPEPAAGPAPRARVSTWLTAAFSPDGRTLAVASSDGVVRLLDTRTWEVRNTVSVPNHPHAVGFDGDVLMVVHCNPGHSTIVRSWLSGAKAPPRVTEVLVDGQHEAIGDPLLGHRFGEGETPWTLLAVDLSTGRERAIASQVDYERALARSRTLVARSTDDGSIHVHDLGTLETKAILDGPAAHALAFSPDGRHLAAGAGAIRIWEVEGWRLVATLRGCPSTVRRLAASSDGRLVAAACGDEHVARIWDVATAAPLCVARGHEDRIWELAFQPAGNLLATSGADGTLRLWEARTGRAVAVITAFDGKWEVTRLTRVE